MLTRYRAANIAVFCSWIAFVLAGSSVGVFINGGPIMGLGQASSLGLPNALWLLLISAGIGFLLLRHTPYGRRLLAVGGNAEAARLAGMPVGLLQLSGYLISALGASIGGILLAGRDGTAIPQAASGTELLIFSAALLGGTSLAGGRASIIGSVLGVLLFNVLYNGFALQSVSPYWQIILQGALLIVAVWLVQQRQQGRDPASVIGQRIRKLVFPR